MDGNQEEKARQLAALEASLAAELTRTRTMMLAAASVARPAELEAAVSAWISDWAEYHTSLTENAILRDIIPVAISRVSVQRVAATVWTRYQHEWVEETAVELRCAVGAEVSREPGICPVQLVPIHLPARFSLRLPVRIQLGEDMRKVPPSVARALQEIAEGAELVRFRKETHTAILGALPELAPHLVRLDDRKVIANKHVYRPSDELRRAIRSE
ncbi:MAG: hypothetical protein IPK87_00870 [Planctomycetes bacterium]|nr:hypothetical protein [Planctomycetota bacterium]